MLAYMHNVALSFPSSGNVEYQFRTLRNPARNLLETLEKLDEAKKSIIKRADFMQMFHDAKREIKENSTSSNNVIPQKWSYYSEPDAIAKSLSDYAKIGLRIREKLERATNDTAISLALLMKHKNDLKSQNLCPIQSQITCKDKLRYRTYSGVCNNVKYPLTGSAHSQFSRLLPAVTFPSSESLPSLQGLQSLLFTASTSSEHTTYSLLLAQWASFLFDDLVHLPIDERGNPLKFPNNNCGFEKIEAGNSVTAYLDGSQIYGSEDIVKELRSFSEGQLKMRYISRAFSIPEITHNCNSKSCFKAGSNRINALPLNAVLYTVWMRQHNFIAKELKRINHFWSDEKLFEESRRIVIAQLQHVTFNEFIPSLIGKSKLKQRGLSLRQTGFDSSYDMNLEQQISNVLSSTVGWVFFTLYPNFIDLKFDGRFAFNALLENPAIVQSSRRFQAIIDVLSSTALRKPGLHIEPNVNALFSAKNQSLSIIEYVMQLSRKNGIPAFGQWREFCRLPEIFSFSEIKYFRSEVDISKLANSYSNPGDIDLLIGLLAEAPESGSLFGPTFGCIFSEQMRNVKRGDRFWYENFISPSSFTEKQLMEIRRKTRLSKILCDTVNLYKIQPNVFQLPNRFENFPISCKSAILEDFDFTSWRDEEPRIKLNITKETVEKAITTGIEQYRRLEEAEGRRQLANNLVSPNAFGAFVAHSHLMAPKPEALRVARKAALLREVTQVILDGLHDLPKDLSRETLQELLPAIEVDSVIGNFTPFLGFNPLPVDECLKQPLPCDHTSSFRTYTGWCNNLRYPHYGNSFQPMRRLKSPAYDDGFDKARSLSVSGERLRSPRAISNVVHKEKPVIHGHYTHMLMQFGQILDHDMVHSPISRGANNTILNCTRCDSPDTVSIHCMPIEIERDDPFFPPFHNDGTPRCINFARSLIGQLTLGYRNQINQLTAYLDASYIYGSSECEANKLRLFRGGALNFTNLGFNKEALPQGQQERDCRSHLKSAHMKCFMAGDERSNEQPGLTVLHTLLLREHNRIATELHKHNAHWSDEKLYQTARRIHIAQLQHVIFAEFLPIILGYETMRKYDLIPQSMGYFEDYDESCDAAISQEMATSAFRFGHTLIRPDFPRMNKDMQFTNDSSIILKNHFSDPSPLYERESGHMESLLIGLLGTSSMEFDRHITDAVRNHLFAKPGGPFTGIDLPAVNIQRGRDHGIPPYNAYRELCDLRKARNFEDLRGTMDAQAIDALKKVYTHVDDIDLFTGMISEKSQQGALVGPTIACVIGEQMRRLKKCDRFYYENNKEFTRFTEDQLGEIRKASLSSIICKNSEYSNDIQPNAFIMPDEFSNARIPCSDLQHVDLSLWIDRDFCRIDNKVLQFSQTERITPCISCTCTKEGPFCHSMVIEKCEELKKYYLTNEIEKDPVCMMQCSKLFKQ